MHDDLCPCINKGDKRWCECDLLARVRADEQWKAKRHTADLRAKVEALPSPLADGHPGKWLLRADVLALLDGADS